MFVYVFVCVCVSILQDRVQVNNGVLTISSLKLADIGMYQCVAENKHGRIFTNTELRVIGKNYNRRSCSQVLILVFVLALFIFCIQEHNMACVITIKEHLILNCMF